MLDLSHIDGMKNEKDWTDGDCNVPDEGNDAEEVFELLPDCGNINEKMGGITKKIKHIEDVPEVMYRDAVRYGYEIMPYVNSYMNFCVALVDYVGSDIIPHCDFIYHDIVDNTPRKISIGYSTYMYTAEYQHYEDDIFAEYVKLKKGQKESRKLNFANNIDELQFVNDEFRSASEFKRMLQFVGIHSSLSPYNALLVFMQKPDSKFVFNADTWKNDFDRQPKGDAQRIITMKPSGGVQCVFDYDDTEPICTRERCLFNFDFELDYKWDEILKDDRKTDVSVEFATLKGNLPSYGILLDWTLKAPDMFAGVMDIYKKKLTVKVESPKPCSIQFDSEYRILLNSRYSEEEAFYFICHELARYMCIYNFCNIKRNNESVLSVKEEQFQIETVKWLLLKRLGIYNPLEDYVDKYAEKGIVPICSIEMVMRAVTELERMVTTDIMPTKSLLYKTDSLFKQDVNKALCKINR